MKPDVLTQIILPISLFIIMLGMGLSLKPANFKFVLSQPKAILFGLVAQIVMLPSLAYLVVLIFNLSGAMAMGLMILALCPGGTTSNLYTYLAKGDVALSVSLTSVVSLIAPLTVPIMIAMLTGVIMGEERMIDLPVLKTAIQLLVITVVPICIGMVIYHYRPVFSAKAEKSVKIFSMTFLLLIVLSIIIKNIDEMGSYFAQVGAAALVLNIACLLMGYALSRLARLNEAQSKAIAIEVGFQNGTLALMIALTLLQNYDMAIPATCYSIIMFMTGALFAKFLNTKSVTGVGVEA